MEKSKLPVESELAPVLNPIPPRTDMTSEAFDGAACRVSDQMNVDPFLPMKPFPTPPELTTALPPPINKLLVVVAPPYTVKPVCAVPFPIVLEPVFDIAKNVDVALAVLEAIYSRLRVAPVELFGVTTVRMPGRDAEDVPMPTLPSKEPPFVDAEMPPKVAPTDKLLREDRTEPGVPPAPTRPLGVTAKDVAPVLEKNWT